MDVICRVAYVFLISLALAACGGGGGGGGSGSSPATTYTVGGTVAGLTGTVVLQNNSGDQFALSSNGTFTFSTSLPGSTAYSVSVLTQPAGQLCVVSNGTGTVASENITSISVNCTTTGGPTLYSIGGNVSGLNGTVVLNNNGGDALTVSANGTFAFVNPLATATAYNITVVTQPAGQTCSVRNNSGSATANIINVSVTCTTNNYTIGGTISGLAGSVTLNNNGGDAITRIGDGAFTFPTAVAHGAAYNVNVTAQPVGQYCGVTNSVGSIAGANVTNVLVSCTTHPLNDTGIDWCFNNNTSFLDCLVVDVLYRGQDAFFGRDAQALAGTLTKTGGGRAGFDFTKLAANGQPLAIQSAAWSDAGSEASGTQWSCVKDNHTGLIWEMKNNDASSLHYSGNTYTWYNTDAGSNGGFAGYANGGTCTGSQCDTQSFAAAVNAQGLCGANDWRVPVKDDLESIVDFSRINPSIDTDYFPNTLGSFWSSSPSASSSVSAWVSFNGGDSGGSAKRGSYSVRLVRAGQ